MFTNLIESLKTLMGVVVSFGQRERDARLRANHAYAEAWQSRSPADTLSDEPLIAAFRARDVPGSYSDPEADPLLGPYVAGWRAGKDPSTLRAELRTENDS